MENESKSKIKVARKPAGDATASRTARVAAPKSAPKGAKGSDPAHNSHSGLSKDQLEALSDAEYDALGHAEFLGAQRILLEAEKQVYLTQAEMFKEEAATLARESEPGDVQFDEESGEGGNSTIERERDLALLASHMATVAEIDEALEKIDEGSYGICESCQLEIPRIRLRALPYAKLCVKCKSGGLSRR